MSRRRGVLDCPEDMKTNDRLRTKAELEEMQKLDQGTYGAKPQNIKVAHELRKSWKFNDKVTAEPLYLDKPVPLSFNYDPNSEQTYFQQNYKHPEKIGEGSFGQVYRVVSNDDQKVYAIKCLRANMNASFTLAEVKNNEMVSENKNCVKFIKAWTENHEAYLVMEYCDLSLDVYALKQHNIPEDLLWNVIFDISNALDYLHKRNFVHLDVKPSNIFMKAGFFKLGDFGLMVDLGHIDLDQPIKSSLSEGDAKYLALEVLEGNYTFSSDIFSLGLTIMELVSDLILADSGPLWQQIRHGYLPKEFYTRATLAMKIMVEKMMNPEHKNRPSAEKLLTYIKLKEVAKRDIKQARIDYAPEVIAEIAAEKASYEDMKRQELPMPLEEINLNNNNMASTTSNNTPLGRDQSNRWGSENRRPDVRGFAGRKSLFTSDYYDDSPSPKKPSTSNFLGFEGFDRGPFDGSSFAGFGSGHKESGVESERFESFGAFNTSSPLGDANENNLNVTPGSPDSGKNCKHSKLHVGRNLFGDDDRH